MRPLTPPSNLRSRALHLAGWLLSTLLVAISIAGHSTALAQGRDVRNDRVSLQALLNEPDNAFTILGIGIEGAPEADLEAREVAVFAPDVRIVVNDGSSEHLVLLPGTKYFRGRMRGVAGSVVAFSIEEKSRLTGLISDGVRTWQLAQTAADGRLEARAVEAGSRLSRPFACGNAHELEPPEVTASRMATLIPPAPELPPGQLYQVNVGVETDHEFWQVLGGTTAATNYVGNLFNFVSAMYEVEAQARLVVPYLSLWSTPADPWLESGSTSCVLREFGRYWRDNRSGVNRSLAHFLSGRSLGGGIAWLGQLCAATTTVNTPTGCATLGNDLVFGGYGVSGSIVGTLQNASGLAWDSIVVAHELGHNVNSPHTHCYANLEGNASTVDGCYNGEPGANCYGGASSLPGTNALTGGTAGSRNGTIMSYCHLLTGGYNNIAPSFGLGHPFGVAPQRVPTRIANYIAGINVMNPACVPIISTTTLHTLNVNSSGATAVPVNGNLIAFSGVTNYSRANLATGTIINLTAPATVGSAVYSSWTGCDTVAGATCTVTMNAARAVTVNYVPAGATHTLNVNSFGATSVAITGNPATYTGSTDYSRTGIANATAITLTAPATSGTTFFTGWTGCNSVSGNNCSLSMTASRSVTASYQAAVPLTNAQSVPNLGGALNSQRHYYIDVPAGTANLTVQSSGGTGNANLYVRLGSLASTAQFDCSSAAGTNAEACVLNNPVPGRFYILVNGAAAYSGLALVATVTAGPPGSGYTSFAPGSTAVASAFNGAPTVVTTLHTVCPASGALLVTGSGESAALSTNPGTAFIGLAYSISLNSTATDNGNVVQSSALARFNGDANRDFLNVQRVDACTPGQVLSYRLTAYRTTADTSPGSFVWNGRLTATEPRSAPGAGFAAGSVPIASSSNAAPTIVTSLAVTCPASGAVMVGGSGESAAVSSNPGTAFIGLAYSISLNSTATENGNVVQSSALAIFNGDANRDFLNVQRVDACTPGQVSTYRLTAYRTTADTSASSFVWNGRLTASEPRSAPGAGFAAGSMPIASSSNAVPTIVSTLAVTCPASGAVMVGGSGESAAVSSNPGTAFIGLAYSVSLNNTATDNGNVVQSSALAIFNGDANRDFLNVQRVDACTPGQVSTYRLTAYRTTADTSAGSFVWNGRLAAVALPTP